MNIDAIKLNSTYPFLSFDFTNDVGEDIDCTNYEVTLLVKNFKNETVITSVVGAEDSHSFWLDEAAGTGEYRWAPEDTSKIGRYRYEFQFKRLYDDRAFKIPEMGYYEYGVVDSIVATP